VGVSGPCAVISALSVSGFPAEPFIFVGFLPRKPGAIIETMAPLTASLPSLHSPVIVFYESPKRIVATVELLRNHFPQISLCLCNDLTKKFEKIYRGSPAEVLDELRDNPHAEKGEYTCVAYMPDSAKDAIAKENAKSLPSPESQLVDIIVKSGCSMKEAIKTLSANQLNNYPKNEIYAASLRLKELFS